MAAIREGAAPTMREAQTDILIVGAGLRGVAGALAALKLRQRVILTEETDWIGGQLTSQAVPPDEHPWIESHGCSASYREFRERVRAWRRRNYPLLPEHRHNPRLNPGGGWVSPLCHEPRVALAVLREMLAPYLASGQLTLWEETIPVAVETDGDTFTAVTLRDLELGEETVVSSAYVLDATDLGDLLDLGEVEHVIGAEGQDQTDELHAPPTANQLDQQAISWCFAIDHLVGEDHTIDKPEHYDFWKGYWAEFWPSPQLGWKDINSETLEVREMAIFKPFTEGKPPRDFWRLRRILDKAKYPAGTLTSDITLVNWPQIDYWLGPLLGVSDRERAKHREGARQLSLSLLYWMQAEAPRHERGYGYPGLRLRGDITGTKHGLAKSAYIRESRRIEAEFTVTEAQVGVEQRSGLDGPAM